MVSIGSEIAVSKNEYDALSKEVQTLMDRTLPQMFARLSKKYEWDGKAWPQEIERIHDAWVSLMVRIPNGLSGLTPGQQIAELKEAKERLESWEKMLNKLL